jgi:mevalonate kinase
MSDYGGKASGRICLLGDNTDLIEKPALAATISAYLTVELKKTGGRRVRLYAKDISYVEEFDLGKPSKLDSPLRYLIAVYKRLSGRIDTGFDAEIESEVPISAGLSSSTALSIAFIEALNDAFSIGLSVPEIAELAFVVENEDLGVECGRMDQYAIAYGGVTYIETGSEPRVETLSTRELPIIVADSEETHNTQELQVWLRRRIRSGEKLLLDSLGRVVDLVEAGKKAVVAGSLDRLGELMNRQQREEKLMGTSTDRLELLCQVANGAGAFGAKQMGAGGGGCIVALCPPKRQHEVKKALEAEGAPVWAFQIVGKE